MPLPDPKLEFELKISNDPRALGAAKMFLHEVLHHTSLNKSTCAGLEEIGRVATEDAITHAYPPGETGSIVIRSIQNDHQIIITVRDFGLPQDVNHLEAALHDETINVRGQTRGLDWAHLADELHWIGYGPEGKELRITRSLHEIPITEHAQRGDLSPFREEAPLAPPQQYEIRRMQPQEALQVSQLMYRAYGGSYFNRDVYYPERMIALNQKSEILSYVAVGENGIVAGHYALERDEDGPVVEGGQAVVDPAHRGRHLLEKMKDAAIDGAKKLGLTGMFGDAVTVHTFTQKSNIAHGARLSCVNLSIAPQTQVFRGIEQSIQSQRITCVLYFLWLKAPASRQAFAPIRHRDAIAKLYANLQCPVTFGEPCPPVGQGELHIRVVKSAGIAYLRTNKIGTDSIAALRHAKRELVEQSHIETVFLDLPLSQPATPAVADALALDGFSFCGIAPHFSPDGDLLRMVYLTAELKRDPIHVEEDIARWLVDYALADRNRP